MNRDPQSTEGDTLVRATLAPKLAKPFPTWIIVTTATMIGAVFAFFSTQGLRHYGFGVFVVLPLLVGWSVAALYNMDREWHLGRTLGVVVMTFAGIALSLMLGLAEGMFCVLLAGVLASPFILLGVLIARFFKLKKALLKPSSSNTKLHCLVVCVIPLSMTLESSVAPTPPLLEQTTSIEIDANPEEVWRLIPAFPRITSPPTKLLAMGMAYPLASEMDGVGVGATRRCVVSTGAMPEVITRWEEARRLEFDVLDTPAAMQETSPFGDVDATHTEGYFICKKGRFVLTALPGGRTRVEGTSWFQHDLWPQFYWAPLTREVVREVHERVLSHIKSLAEARAN